MRWHSSHVVALLGVLLAAAQTVRGGEGVGEKYALLVGVHKYSEAKELRPLPFAENDVTELAAVLRDNGFKPANVVLMTQKRGADDPRFQPLKARIHKELRLLLANRQAGDTLLLAFAGHGVHFKDDKNTYICPADADLEDKATLLPVGELYDELSKCGAGVRMLLIDACRNDPFVQRTRAAVDLTSVTRPELPAPPGGVVAFFSCSDKEKAYEDVQKQHGVFFRFVIEGLRGEAAGESGEVTVPDLEKYVKRSVQDHVRAEYGKAQTPELLNRSRGLVSLLPANPALPHYRKGLEFNKLFKYDEAIDDLSEAIRLNPRHAPSYTERALANAATGSQDKAIADFDQALRLNPEDAKALAGRGRARAKRKEYALALADTNRAIQIEPKFSSVWIARAWIWSAQNEEARALDDYAQAIRLDPPQGYRFRGDYWRGKGQPAKAIADYTKALQAEPDYTCVYVNRAVAFNEQKQYDKAAADCSEVLRQHPKYRCATCRGMAYLNRGAAYVHLDQNDQAVADISEGLALLPKETWAYVKRGWAYYKQQEYDKAIADSSEAIRLQSDSVDAYRLRAAAYRGRGDTARANADEATVRRLAAK